MKFNQEYLGKVSITCNGVWDVNRPYDRLCLVNDGFFASYISKTAVPVGTPLNDNNYWQPVANLREDVKLNIKEFEANIIKLIAEIQIKFKYSRIVVKTIEERDQLTIQEIMPGVEVYVLENKMSYILVSISITDNSKVWKLVVDSKIDSCPKMAVEGMPKVFTADRAVRDAHGNIIHDNYLTRETVREYMKQVVADYLEVNKPEIADGSITYDDLAESVKQLFGSTGNVTNLPDEEDITTINDQLKFKDRQYKEGTFNGMGYKILRKNPIANINLLDQSMINEPNTIYEIRYDFCLDGNTINIPENCVLKFEGGSFRNGTVVGNNTIIVSNSQCFQNILLTNFNNNIIHDYWFYDDIEDILESVQQGILQLSPIQYTINKDIYVKAEVKIIGDNTKFISNKSIYLGWRNSIRNIYFKSDNNNDSPVIKLDSNHIQDSINELANKPDTHYTYLNLTIDNCEFDGAKLAINAILSNTRIGWGFNIINNRFIYTTLGIKFEINPDDEDTDAWFNNIDIRGNKFTEGGNGILFDKGNSPKYTRYGGIFIEGNAIQYQENTEYFLKMYCVNSAVVRDNKIWDTSNGYFIHKYSCKFVVIYDFFANTSVSNFKVFEDTGDTYNGRDIVQCNYYNGYLQKVKNTFPQPLNGEFYSFRDLQYIPDGNYSVNTETVKKLINDENLKYYNDRWYIDIKTYDSVYRRINISYSLINSSYVQNSSYNYVEYITEFYVNTSYPNERIPLEAFRFICSPYYTRVTNDIPYKPKGLPIWEVSYGKLGCINDNGEFVGYNGKTIGRDYGITSERPTLISRDAGYMYYDITLRKPIWWNGSTWVDATGAAV